MSRTRQAHLVDTRSAGNLSGLLSSHAGDADSAAFGEGRVSACLPSHCSRALAPLTGSLQRLSYSGSRKEVYGRPSLTRWAQDFLFLCVGPGCATGSLPWFSFNSQPGSPAINPSLPVGFGVISLFLSCRFLLCVLLATGWGI